MKRVLSLLLTALLIATASHAAPSVSSVSGTVTNGSALTIAGSSFGTGPADVSWTGASIEAGTVGNAFTATNWASDTDPDWALPMYSTTQAHSGTKSIYCGVTAGDEYNSIFTYDFPNPITSSGTLFLSFWVRITPSDGHAWHQWKINRFSNAATIVDGYNQLIMFSWDNENGTQVCVDPNVIVYSGVEPSPVGVTSTWQRIDQYIVGGVSAGSYTITQYVPGVSKTADILDPYATFRSGENWNWLIFQNYLGNTSSGSADIYYDDIYVSANSRARVEIGDASTYTACTHFEIQPSTSWSSSSIGITCNRGSFGASDTAYVYVIASDGTYNSTGKAITFGGGSSDTTNPSVAITSPTSSSTYSTSNASLYLAGTASDNVAVSSVAWTNSAGGSGTATGTTSWSVASITLTSGTNIITVTATDSSGNTAIDTITVTYTPSAPSAGGVIISGCTLSGVTIN